MAFFWVTHRTIAYEARAQQVIDEYTDPHDRFHDQLQGLEWLVARSPSIGLAAQKDLPTQHLLYVSKGDAFAKTSDIWLLYSYDDETVTVHGFKVVSEDG
jgi:hypothetical protein